MKYTLVTDGAYSSKRDTGGLAFVFLKGEKLILEYCNSYKHTTNNRMELGAIILGLKCIKNSIDSLAIVSDSMYCIGTITLNWKRKKNIDLWNEFDKELERVSDLCKNIEWVHIRGHQSSEDLYYKWNNYCDKLACGST